MADAQSRTEVAELLERHGVAPRRRLGQHFLVDPNITRKLVGLVGGSPGERVLEVGAGTGTLTRALAEAGYRVLAYEVDRRLRPVLEEVLGGTEGVELRFQDALEADLPEELGGGKWRMASNLPYNVGTPLLMTLLREALQVVRLVVMVQREVAERLIAPPGSRTYGLPSVVVQLHARLETTFRVPPQVFLPPPRVESAVLVLGRRALPAGAEEALELAGRAFAQRRKMLRSSLGETVDEEVFRAAGIDPRRRPEEVPPEGFVALARAGKADPPPQPAPRQRGEGAG